MSWYRRAPHAGWYVVLTLALCILAVSWAATTERRAIALTRHAQAVLDSLAAGQWVQIGPYDRVYRGKAPGDSLPRAAR